MLLAEISTLLHMVMQYLFRPPYLDIVYFLLYVKPMTIQAGTIYCQTVKI